MKKPNHRFFFVKTAQTTEKPHFIELSLKTPNISLIPITSPF